MNHYKNIIFDLGGVIINLDYQATTREFSKLCGRDMQEAYSKKKQDPIFDDLETGRISPEEFREGLMRIFDFKASHQAIDDAWNALLLDIPQARLDLIQELGKQKRVFLLSNTNEIHKIAFEKTLADGSEFKTLSPLFEKDYYSHIMGKRKPHVEIFEQVIEENRLNPSETLFIDDSPQHIEGAKKAKLNAFHLTGPRTILDLGLL